MAIFEFKWKLIGGDAFEQEFRGFATQQEAYKAWHDFWGVEPCECEYCYMKELEGLLIERAER